MNEKAMELEEKGGAESTTGDKKDLWAAIAAHAAAIPPSPPVAEPLPPQTDPTRLPYWFPLVRDAGLPVPRTEIVTPTDEENRRLWRAWYDGPHHTDDPVGDSRAATLVHNAVRDAAVRVAGESGPFFLRTDLTSAKHDWQRSCFVADRELIPAHMAAIADYSGCFVDEFPRSWAVREMLKTRPLFTSFYGRMPITREFRFFVEDGRVSHIQGYWPPEAFEKDAERDETIAKHLASTVRNGELPPKKIGPDVPDWRERLAAASVLEPVDLANLVEASLIAAIACRSEWPNWSVDWLETADRGWVLTDMAVASRSYRWADGRF